MTTHDAPAAPTAKMIRKVTMAGAIGTTVEFYDYFIYGTAAALVLNKVFFPNVDPLIGTLTAFATFGVGFVARPFGAVVFGHLADKVGRKKMLVFSLLLMGFATFGMGLLPTFDQIGVWAPILLVVLRLCQGFAVGGEWGGATVLATEFARPNRRGLVGSIVQIGSPAGLLLATGMFALITQLPDDQLIAWGWRIPFLSSMALVAIGLYIRLNILESPEFERAKKELKLEESAERKIPVVEVFRTSWRSLLVAMGARFAPDIGFYIAGTFIVSYGKNLGYAPSAILTAITVAAALEVIAVPFFGALSDKIGRRKVYMAGALFWIVFAFPFFWLVNTVSGPLLWLSVIVAFVLGHGAMWAVAASFYAELFPTHVRTTGASLGYNLSIVFGGGPAPFLAASLVAANAGASWPVSLYLILAGTITFVAVLLAKETVRRDLGETDAKAAGAGHGTINARTN
ncbi:MFS transporter [Arthrobacter sp. NPDC080031]|uniref:MFS transporter n=1 Tax=Arthrobacter sp. NPDC080031 TaxID=3155918 RepID=UPI00344EF991